MTPFIFLLAALAGCYATFLILRGGWTSPAKTTILGLDPQGIGLSVLAVAAAVWFFGVTFGLAIIAVVIIHEFGHVAAFRVVGHHDASFRLVPLLGGYAISSREPATQEERVFVTLMGPAICLAPMVLAFALVPYAETYFPTATGPLITFASISGALNFFNLLPIWPLDGGRLTATITSVFHEKAPLVIFAITTGLIALVALLSQSLFIIILVVIGVQHLVQTGGSDGTPPYARMSKRRALLCLGAWLFTAAALLYGGIGTLLRFV